MSTNTILLPSNVIRSIDDQTLAVDITGGTLTLTFASQEKMRHTAEVIIAATDLHAPPTPIDVDKVTTGFHQSYIGLIPRILEGAAPAPDENEEFESDILLQKSPLSLALALHYP